MLLLLLLLLPLVLMQEGRRSPGEGREGLGGDRVSSSLNCLLITSSGSTITTSASSSTSRSVAAAPLCR